MHSVAEHATDQAVGHVLELEAVPHSNHNVQLLRRQEVRRAGTKPPEVTTTVLVMLRVLPQASATCQTTSNLFKMPLDAGGGVATTAGMKRVSLVAM